jgi:hypothetical protein
VPHDGRWFTYIQLRQDGHDVEAWLPLQADQKGTLTEDRQLYRPAAAGSARPVETAAGVGIYGFSLALLVLAIRQTRRARPHTSPPSTQR